MTAPRSRRQSFRAVERKTSRGPSRAQAAAIAAVDTERAETLIDGMLEPYPHDAQRRDNICRIVAQVATARRGRRVSTYPEPQQAPGLVGGRRG